MAILGHLLQGLPTARSPPPLLGMNLFVFLYSSW